MKIRHLAHGLLTVLLSALLLGAVNVHAQLAEEPATNLSEAEALRLRQILDTPIDLNTLNLNKIKLFRQKDLAAFKLGDFVALEKNAREWALVEPEDGKWRLMSILAGTEKRAESYQLVQELINETRWKPSAVRLRSQLARNYMDDNRLKEAGQLIDEAEKIVRYDFSQIPRRGDASFHIARAEMEFLVVKSNYLMRTGRWAEGIEGSKLAVAKGKELLRLAALVQVETWRTYGQVNALFAMVDLSTHQLAAGLYSDAEWTLRETFKLAKAQGLQEMQLAGVYNRVADLYIATGQYKDALQFAQRSEKIVLSTGFQKGSPNWVFTQMRAGVALAGQDAWPQALASLDEIDAQVIRVKTPAALASRTPLRAYIYLKNGRQVDALRVLRDSLKFRVDNFGDNHYLTASIRGLLAVALWQNNLLPEARTEFDTAMRNMTAPDSLSGNFVENAFEKKTRHYILQSYMGLLAKTAATQPKDAEILFQVADQLNASSVQQALSDAAVRAGVSVPG
jgi:tetratricopeptide (TPR) repeat protein